MRLANAVEPIPRYNIAANAEGFGEKVHGVSTTSVTGKEKKNAQNIAPDASTDQFEGRAA